MKNKVVIITGGAKGIGRYVAGTFVGAGAKVALADVDPAALQRTADELNEKGGDVLALATDVRQEAQVKDLVAQVMSRFGRIDILINNAAIVSHAQIWPNPAWGAPWPVVRDMSLEFWNRVVETNVTGTFLCSKHVIPHMERAGGGHIMTIQGGGPVKKHGVLAYAMTKQACDMFAMYLAEEVRAANICVLIVNPGGAIGTEEAPKEVFDAGCPTVDIVGNRFVLAAQAPMSMSGRAVNLKDGVLELLPLMLPQRPHDPTAGAR